jgi:hypothetical protein
MRKAWSLLIIGLLSTTGLFAQHHAPVADELGTELDWPHFRAAIVLGHTLIPVEQTQDHIFIPSWGLDIEYWNSPHWGLGLHADIEIESFIILAEDGEEIERINPVVLTLDALHRLPSGLVFVVGPGVELERSRAYALFRLGLEYEIELPHHYDLAPTVFYDHRFDGYTTWSIGLGVGKRF